MWKNILIKYRRLLIVATHVILITLAYWMAFILRFEFSVPDYYWMIFLKTLPLVILVKIIAFYYYSIFQGLWRYVSIGDLWQILKANFLSTLILMAVLILGFKEFPLSVFFIDSIICIFLLSGIRFFTRIIRERFNAQDVQKSKSVLIVGAGEAGILTLKEYRRHPALGSKIIGFIDDDPVKKNNTVHGIKVLGGKNDIKRIAQHFNVTEIIIAMPSAKGEIIRDIISNCQIPDVKVKIVPKLNSIFSGELEIRPREVKSEDLLGRETVRIDEGEISNYINGKNVLVTGAGGSIGSELCRQIVCFNPREILLFDHNENDVYFLQVEFKTKYPDVKIKVIIGDIRDVGLLKQTFSRNKPQIIFHAAAHKHVPLMEENPSAAIKNNVIGTRNLIYAANHYKVEKFVLISTDKAVNPVNVMGMSKRITEIILQAKAKSSHTKFMAVRFGNVIGSAGSVVPLLKRQIENGGPLTITDPEAERYFMSVKEAALLVLQAGAIGKGGELFILDMGEQIKMIDIAKNLIALSGLRLEKDISIKYIGLRAGEKLSEELLLDKEKDKVTKHEKIFVSHSEGTNPRKLRILLKELERMANLVDDQKIVLKMKEIIFDHEAR